MANSAPEQRKEIAEKLLEKYRERMEPGQFNVQDLGLQALGYLEDLEECLPDGKSAFTVIADLIDPTCKRVAMDAAGNPPYYTGGLALNDVVGGCSECGYPFGGSYHNLGNLFNAPNYCPNCGARVMQR